jgi:hypothetical protein
MYDFMHRGGMSNILEADRGRETLPPLQLSPTNIATASVVQLSSSVAG